jgi:hypothetical protein
MEENELQDIVDGAIYVVQDLILDTLDWQLSEAEVEGDEWYKLRDIAYTKIVQELMHDLIKDKLN